MTREDIFMIIGLLCVIAAFVVIGLYAAEKYGLVKEPIQLPSLPLAKYSQENTTISNGTMAKYGHNASVPG